LNRVADQCPVEAVQAGDEAAAGQALADGADPNTAVWHTCESVLVEAARGGDPGIVRLLVGAGARAGPAGPHTTSPLRAAVARAHTDVVRILIGYGALAAEHSARTGVLSEAVSDAVSVPSPPASATLRLLLQAGAVTALTRRHHWSPQ
jgi:hypothetical protein